MANRDFNKIKRTIQDFSLNAGSGTGGAVKVNKLPEVGEEDVIYELEEREIIPGSYNWVCVPVDSNYFGNSSRTIITVDKREDILEIVSRELVEYCYSIEFYVKNEDIIIRYIRDDYDNPIEIQRNENGLFVLDEYESISIVSSYQEELTYVEGHAEDYTINVTLPDGTTKTYTSEDLDYPGIFWQLKEIKKDDKLLSEYGYTVQEIYLVSKLPTAKDVIDNNYYNIISGQKKRLIVMQGEEGYIGYDYSAYSDILKYEYNENKGNFYVLDDEGEETDEIYTGELDWYEPEALGTTDKLFFIIPDESEYSYFVFTPTPEEVIVKSTKYVYENGTWINLDKPSIDETRFIKVEELDNVYAGDKILGLHIKYDFQKYYEELTSKGKTIIPYDTESNMYDYRDHDILSVLNTAADYYSDSWNINVFLKYDEEGNVWAYLNAFVEWGTYSEISSAIKVATPSDLENPEFEFPIVEFEVPTDLPDFDTIIVVKTKSTNFTEEPIIKIWK